MTTTTNPPVLPDPATDPAAATGLAVLADPCRAKAAQAADVVRWFDRIKAGRKFDEPAREQYAKDRRYARGDSGFEVDANIVGTNIDILESFLYARDPDIDCRPAASAEPPTLESMRDAADDYVSGMPDLAIAQQQASAAVLHDTGDQGAAQQAGQKASDALKDHMVQQQFQKLRKRYQRVQRDNKAFAETLEIVVSHLWKVANLKPRGVRWVRSALTVGLGVLKATWQERTAPSAETVQALNDLQAMIQRTASMRAELDEASGSDADAKLAEYHRQVTTLKAQSEVVVSRGFVIDVVPPEDFQVAPGYTIADHLDAPWNSHRIPIRASDAKAQFALTDEEMRQATRYAARAPVMVQRESAMIDKTVQASDADAYTSALSEGNTTYAGDNAGDFFMLEEIWDRDAGCVLTGIHGIKNWVKDAWNPTATTRFYPFFVLCTSEVDGQRHPQSLVSRSAKLIDEYNRIGSAEAEHRRRVLPGIIFHAGAIGMEEMTKIETSQNGEWTGIKTTLPNANMRDIFVEKPYARLDPALYDRQRIVNELERIWGVQEALSGSINTQKTAAEAEIQQSGFNARTTGRRDQLEFALVDLAQYTAELARAHIDVTDVQAIAGQDAMWPEYDGPSDLARMVQVDIRSGSSGKPDTSRERQAMATLLPILQNAIGQIGQLRGASPEDMADAHEELVKLAVASSGDRIDIGALMPQAGNGPGAGADQHPLPPAETAMMGPQTVALTQVLDQVRTGVLSTQSACALIQAAFPGIPEPLVQQMVQGVQVAPPALPMPGNPGLPDGHSLAPPSAPVAAPATPLAAIAHALLGAPGNPDSTTPPPVGIHP